MWFLPLLRLPLVLGHPPGNLSRPLSSFAVFNPRRRSLLRGNLLVLGSLAAAFRLSDFPRSRATLLLLIPAVLALVGTVDTARCMQPRWNFYHSGVVLCIYMDLLVIMLILYFLLSPYVLYAR
jgi:hypothetical protein